MSIQMKVIIIHYQVIQDAKKCSNITIRKKNSNLKIDLVCKKNQTSQTGKPDLVFKKKHTHTPKE